MTDGFKHLNRCLIPRYPSPYTRRRSLVPRESVQLALLEHPLATITSAALSSLITNPRTSAVSNCCHRRHSYDTVDHPLTDIRLPHTFPGADYYNPLVGKAKRKHVEGPEEESFDDDNASERQRLLRSEHLYTLQAPQPPQSPSHQ